MLVYSGRHFLKISRHIANVYIIVKYILYTLHFQGVSLIQRMNYADHGFCRLSFEVGHFFEQVSHSADLLALIFVRRGASSVVCRASCFVDR